MAAQTDDPALSIGTRYGFNADYRPGGLTLPKLPFWLLPYHEGASPSVITAMAFSYSYQGLYYLFPPSKHRS